MTTEFLKRGEAICAVGNDRRSTVGAGTTLNTRENQKIRKSMGKILLMVCFVLIATNASSQVKGKWRGGVDMGWGFISPVAGSGTILSYIPTTDLNIGYNLTKNMNVGFKAGWGGVMLVNRYHYLGNTNCNFTGTYTYYFGKRTNLFIPFVGGGLGVYVLFPYHKKETKFGGFLSTGFEIGKFRFAANCELILPTKVVHYYYDEWGTDKEENIKIKNSYFSVTVGFYIGGGNRKKALAAWERERIALEREKERAESFSAFAEDYIDLKISVWQQKGEFEKTEDWHQRVNEKSIAEKKAELTKEAEKIFIAARSRQFPIGNITLDTYDTDNEVFLIRNSVHGDWFVPVPFAEAPSFKESWNNLVKTPQYIIHNDKIAFAGYRFSSIEVANTQKENQTIVNQTTETKQSEQKDEVVKNNDKLPFIDRQGSTFYLSDGKICNEEQLGRFLIEKNLNGIWIKYSNGKNQLAGGWGMIGVGVVFELIGLVASLEGYYRIGIVAFVMAGISESAGIPIAIVGAVIKNRAISNYNMLYGGKSPNQYSQDVTFKAGIVGNGIGFSLNF